MYHMCRQLELSVDLSIEQSGSMYHMCRQLELSVEGSIEVGEAKACNVNIPWGFDEGAFRRSSSKKERIVF